MIVNMTKDEYIERLIGISKKKCGLLSDTLLLTKAQTQSITEESLEKLQGLIADKQTKIEAVGKLDEEFDIYFRRLKSELKIGSLDELKNFSGIKGIRELQDTIRQIMNTINDICEIEKKNNMKAKELLNELGDEIKKINQGKKMNSAYMPGPVKPPSYFIDKKK